VSFFYSWLGTGCSIISYIVAGRLAPLKQKNGPHRFLSRQLCIFWHFPRIGSEIVEQFTI
jgi:hypothetical protein